jgi:hypothetical protein
MHIKNNTTEEDIQINECGINECGFKDSLKGEQTIKIIIHPKDWVPGLLVNVDVTSK